MSRLEELRVVRREEVTRLTGLARATLYAKVADGTFPPPGPPGRPLCRLARVGHLRLAAGPGAAMGPVRRCR